MKAIVVDDEPMARALFCYEAKQHRNVEIMKEFSNGADAIQYVKCHQIDLAVLDIFMPGMNGIDLAAELKQILPNLVVIYLTGYEEYAMDALRLRAAAYILKPYTSEEIHYALETAALLTKRGRKRIFARTFGHFDIFVEGKPILFKSAKAKEMLALLIDRRGGTVTTEQMISMLWEERPNDEGTQNLCSKTFKTLLSELKEYEAEDIIISRRGVRSIDTEKIDCDYYELMSDTCISKSYYCGEYMSDYSWGEERIPFLNQYL